MQLSTKFCKLGLLALLFALLGLSCGMDDEEKTAPCTNQNCDNPQPPSTNLIGTWTVTDDDEGFTFRETVTFNADGTGFADENSRFTILLGNASTPSSPTVITEFEWEFQDDEERYLVDFGIAERFYTILELDCDYMKLNDNYANIESDSAEKPRFIMCREK